MATSPKTPKATESNSLAALFAEAHRRQALKPKPKVRDSWEEGQRYRSLMLALTGKRV